ncbi:unnamed protein product [Allacma fusca]|uniref:Uncharacterized protein n=1 Tax=Allacma fusca TaxID=39272 RepID=A0A8J2PSA3_9HEXA|nr:unnamed protein product [Allacma fusca]
MGSKLRKCQCESDDFDSMEFQSNPHWSKYGKSKDEEELIPIIPALASAIFLHNLRDVHLLKTCRLVCKSWNIEACDSLRACSKASFAETSSRFQDFMMLIFKKAVGPLQYFPSPFQDFHVERATLTNPAFIEFVLNIPIKSIGLELDDGGEDGLGINQHFLNIVLGENRANITSLEIQAWSDKCFNRNEKTTTTDGYQLPFLKRLKFQDYCFSCTHMQLMENILSISQPEWLHLNIPNQKSVECLLPKDKVEHLKELELHFQEVSKKTWNHLNSLRLLRLTSLKFMAQVSVITIKKVRQWRSFCENVSPLLEEFETNLPISFEPSLAFPRLKSIKLVELNENKDILSCFTPDNFPSLVEVKLGIQKPFSIYLRHGIPHKGVSSLDLNINGWFEENYSFSLDLKILLTHLNKQYPEVTSLTFFIGKFWLKTIPDIFESFPKLKFLNLDGNCDLACFSGLNDSMITEYSSIGVPIEEIPRRNSIVDFNCKYNNNFM